MSNYCAHKASSVDACPLPAVSKNVFCTEHGCCLCGGAVAEDTRHWKVYLCCECLYTFTEGLPDHLWDEWIGKLVNAAYEAGRKSVG